MLSSPAPTSLPLSEGNIWCTSGDVALMWSCSANSAQSYFARLCLTCPWSIFREACQQAGMQVVRIVTEPTAAIVAYGLHNHHVVDHKIKRDAERANYLVLNIGSTESSCTIMTSDQGLLQERSHETSNEVSAKHFNKVIMNILATEFQKTMKVDLADQKRAQTKLALAADTARRALYKQGSVPASIDGLHDGVDLNCNIPRAKFEAMSQAVAKHASNLIAAALKSAGLSPKAITKVVYAGDGAHSKKLLDGLKSAFGDDKVMSHVAGEEVFALGACKHAVMMQDLDDTADHVAASVTVKAVPQTLGYVDQSGQFCPLVRQGTPVPYLYKSTFALAKSQTSFKLTLARPDGDGHEPLAVLRAKSLGKVADIPQATLSLSFDEEANVTVVVSSPEQNDITVTLES
eukprot:TRINITY_DN7041_c0_g1_i2.p1 TRINITY_DN7041_c0_g1~~TRINITY_DN7041_c0_g1_i2.p1  ORF type:complete len:404 (+),score=99.34 TRINITY_DN7041_c0_g1_i2:515-1726(+)